MEIGTVLLMLLAIVLLLLRSVLLPPRLFPWGDLLPLALALYVLAQLVHMWPDIGGMT